MRSSRSILAALALVAFFLVLPRAAWTSGGAEPSRPNVLLVLVDAMRAQSLGPHGYRVRDTTPNLDKLAARGVVWENAQSQNAWTIPCVASLFSSLDPQAHRVLRGQGNEMDTMSPTVPTIAEQFQAAGYTTSAFLKSIVIQSSQGMSQGFEKFELVGGADQAHGYSAKQLNDVAIPWLLSQKGASKPFFTYLHYMDPHSPYRPPEPWYSKHKGGYTGTIDGGHSQVEALQKSRAVPAPADVQRLLGLYDSDIEYWDTELGRLLSELQKAGLDANTIVVVTADHGEAFYEHQQWFHGALWQENIHIPVIVKAPGLAPGRLAGWSQQIDIAPTLADLAGIPRHGDWMGRSQAAAMRTGRATGDLVYSEYTAQRMGIDQRGMKLILGDGAPKLFDLTADPLEKTDVASARPAEVTRLAALVDQRAAQGKALAARFPATAPETLTDEQIEALRALGYME